MDEKVLKIFFIAIVFVGVILLAFMGLSFLKPKESNYPAAYSTAQTQQFFNSEVATDICKTPQGYTAEQWKEHMSHHPDRYAQCFK